MIALKRNNGRPFDKVRPILLERNVFGYADSSILYSAGNTKVLVSVSLQDGVPKFLRGKKAGWLTAEYSMLPCATHRRKNRESSQAYRNSRSIEISRLIGRSLRSVVDLSLFQDKTIYIDCDVLQADGSTRVACISAAGLALRLAVDFWINKGIIKNNIIKDDIVAVSVGKFGDEFLLDLSFSEDSNADADFNFILSRSGKIVEIQGTSEKFPISWQDFDTIKSLSLSGVEQIFKIFDDFRKKYSNVYKKNSFSQRKTKAPLFSLGNRLNKEL